MSATQEMISDFGDALRQRVRYLESLEMAVGKAIESGMDVGGDVRRAYERSSLASSRDRKKPVLQPCAHCGTQYAPHHGKSVYCSDQCKFKAYRKRKKIA